MCSSQHPPTVAELLQKAWGTDLLCDISLFGPMVLVALPKGVVGESAVTYEDAERVQDTLYHQFKIEVVRDVVLSDGSTDHKNVSLT